MPHVLGGGSEEGMRMKMDRESLAVAAFRLWSQNEAVGRIAREVVGTVWDPAAEQKTSITERFRWVSTEFDVASVRVVTSWRSIWANAGGAKTVFAAGPTDLVVRTPLWRDISDPAPLDKNDVHILVWRARAIWGEIVAGMPDRLLQGAVRAHAREGSPTARVAEIPASAWHHLTVDDWDAGTAISGDGRQFFDLQVEGPANPVGRRGKVGPAAQAIIELYPSGDYPSEKEMLTAIKARTGKSLSPRTLSRAKLAIKPTP